MVSRSNTWLRAALLSMLALATVGALANEAGVQLALEENERLGQIVTDGAGNTLYVFTQDEAGDSTCYDECAQAWRPYAAGADVAVGAGLDLGLVGTIERRDGTTQVTYGGRPLYTFAGDAEAGAADGHGLDDAWFAIGADGDPAEALAATAEDDLFATYMTEGANVYRQTCAVCHGANGDEALASHVAILASNSRVGNERLVLRRIIHGSGYMPAFGDALSDHEVAAVATFVRNSFGNDFGLVGEEAAASTR